MIFSFLSKVVQGFLPGLSKGLSLPNVASKVFSIICEKLGVSSDTSEKDLCEMLKGDPSLILKLKDAEKKHEIEILKADQDHEKEMRKQNEASRKSARSAALERRKAGSKEWTPSFLAIMTLVSFMAFIGALLYIWRYGLWINDPIKDIIEISGGILGSQFATVIGFYFGSSYRSNK